MTTAKQVRITDVSPRDGLQNEAGQVSTDDKFRLVGMLAAAGVDEVECTSFVSPKWVPQLADSAALVARINALGGAGPASLEQVDPTPEWAEYLAGDSPCEFSVLVPNDKGMESFLDANVNPARPMEAPPLVQKIAVFTAASETFSKRNTNATIAETLARFVPVIGRAQQHLLSVRGYISCVIACPFEGPINPQRVADVAARLAEMGCDEIDLGDTIGAGTPETVTAMIQAVSQRLGGLRLNRLGQPVVVLHLHDTFGRAGDCVRAALDCGIRSFDASVAGLGGCPYAGTPGKPAPGNIATELLVRIIHEAGYTTGVRPARLAEAAAFARATVTKARAAAANTAGGAS